MFIKFSRRREKMSAPKQGFKHKISPYWTSVLVVLALKKQIGFHFHLKYCFFYPKVQVSAFRGISLNHKNSTKYFTSAISHCQSFPISAHTTPLLHTAHLVFESSYKSPINLFVFNSIVYVCRFKIHLGSKFNLNLS